MDSGAMQGGPTRGMVLLAMLVLAGLVGAVFFPVVGFEFVDFDTYDQVLTNPYIRGLTYANLKYIFTSRCITSYYPVRTLTFAVDFQLWGLQAGGFKLTNVLIHVANCLLVFWLILRLSRYSHGDGRAGLRWVDWGVALWGAALFAIHPVVVEPVIWVPGREELLMALGALGTIHFHLSARRRELNGPRAMVLANHGGAVFCCAIACLSNAVAAIIPAFVIAWDVLMLRGGKWTRTLLAAAPLCVIAIATVITKTFGQPEETAVNLIEMSWVGRAMIGLNAYWLHLKTLVWPHPLCLYYDWLYPEGFLDVDVLLGIVAVVLTLGTLWSFRRHRPIVFGVLWFVLALAPTLQIVIHHIHRADRFMYLPLVGVAVAVALALRLGAEKVRGRAAVAATVVGSLAIVTALATRSALQVPIWRTSLGVWQHCLAVQPDNARAHDVVGDHYLRRGLFREAMSHYETVLRLRPYAVEALVTYGFCLADWAPELRDYDRSIELLRRACTVTGWQYAATRSALAEAHARYAYDLQLNGNYARAIQEYERALEARTDDALVAFNLALLLATCPDAQLRRPAEAISWAEWAQRAEAEPTVNGQLILAAVYAQVGRYRAAAIAMARARDLDREFGDGSRASDFEVQMGIYEKLAEAIQ